MKIDINDIITAASNSSDLNDLLQQLEEVKTTMTRARTSRDEMSAKITELIKKYETSESAKIITIPIDEIIASFSPSAAKYSAYWKGNNPGANVCADLNITASLKKVNKIIVALIIQR